MFPKFQINGPAFAGLLENWIKCTATGDNRFPENPGVSKVNHITKCQIGRKMLAYGQDSLSVISLIFFFVWIHRTGDYRVI